MNKLMVVMYHYVRDLKQSRYPKIKGLDYCLFREQISYLNANYNIITMEQVIEAWENGGTTLPSNAMLLTFDDGYIDHYLNVLPILNEFKIQGSFFIPGKVFTENSLLNVNKIHFILASVAPSQLVNDIFEMLDFYRGSEFSIPNNDELYNQYAVANRFDTAEVIFSKRILQTALPERLRDIISTQLFKRYVGVEESVFARELYMNTDQIAQMKRCGMYIGFHGYDHYWLGNLTEGEMKTDIDKSMSVLGGYVEKNQYVFNYPYGNYNENVINYLNEKGVKLSMTTEPRIANMSKDDPYKIPRFDCNDFPPKNKSKMFLDNNL